MSNTDASLIRMANQIADFFRSQRHETPELGVADHIAAFWSYAMRDRITLLVEEGQDDGLSPLARAAIRSLQTKSDAKIAASLQAEGGIALAESRGSDAG